MAIILIKLGEKVCACCGKKNPKQVVRTRDDSGFFSERCMVCFTKETGVSAKVVEKNCADNLDSRILQASIEVQEFVKLLAMEQFGASVDEQKKDIVQTIAEQYGLEAWQIV